MTRESVGGPAGLSGARAALVTGASAFVVLTLLAATGPAASLDRRVTVWIFRWPDAWTWLMHATWWSATRPVALIWIGLALLVWRRPQPAVAMTAAALVSWGLALLTKQLVGRPRPSALLLGAAPRDLLAGYGYPSAHAALAGALVTPVLFVVPQAWRPWLVSAVVLVAASRVYSGAHFALDALGGVALGVTCGSAAVVVFSKVRPIIGS